LIDWLCVEYNETNEDDLKKIKDQSNLVLEAHINNNKEATRKQLRSRLRQISKEIIFRRYEKVFTKAELK